MGLLHWFQGFFQKEDALFKKVFGRIEKLTEQAMPIVHEVGIIAAGVAANDPTNTKLAALSGYLTKVGVIGDTVSKFVTDNATAPQSNVLHNAAVIALAHTSGALHTSLSDLDTSVQLAYSAYKEKTAPAVPATPAPPQS